MRYSGRHVQLPPWSHCIYVERFACDHCRRPKVPTALEEFRAHSNWKNTWSFIMHQERDSYIQGPKWRTTANRALCLAPEDVGLIEQRGADQTNMEYQARPDRPRQHLDQDREMGAEVAPNETPRHHHTVSWCKPHCRLNTHTRRHTAHKDRNKEDAGSPHPGRVRARTMHGHCRS